MPMLGKSPSFLAKFAVGYGVTVVAGLAAYPIDTVRGRMMLCPGGYPTALACAQSILANEGAANLFLGAGYNIARGVFGALVLSLCDAAKASYIKHNYPTA